MKNHDTIERATERKYKAKDKRNRKRMKVSGKSVFTISHLMQINPTFSKRKKKK